MTLNEPLLKALRAVEARYGTYPEEWPLHRTKHLQRLAQKRVISAERKSELLEVSDLFQRGFYPGGVARTLHRSRTWAIARKPSKYSYMMTDRDERVLRLLVSKGKSNSEISRLMSRDVRWIKEMRDKL